MTWTFRPKRPCYDVFMERGFIEQVTDEGKLRELLKGKITCYIGFDPTASSLSCGKPGSHHGPGPHAEARPPPIALVGGGTGLVGDPSGKDGNAADSELVRRLSRMPRLRKSNSPVFLDFSKGSGSSPQQCRLADQAQLHRFSQRHRRPFQRQSDAGE